jgi:hypothetical protein
MTEITHSDQTSYLTVNVNGNYYTNNQNLVLSGRGMPLPTYPTAFLNNGKTSYTGPNKDTIETIWEPQGPNAFEIIQDIYTVEFPIVGSGQVVYRFSVKDLQNEPVAAQAQFLLDVDLGITGSENDAAPITTRYGYLTSQVTSYPNSITPYIPPYFIATLQPVDSGSFPLLMAEGYTNDSLAPEPMGLTEPSLIAYVNWPDVVHDSGYTWGFPALDIADDEALLFQWPSSGADSGQTMVLASFSYGSAACTPICLGSLDAMLVHPEHIVWSPAINSYVPNHFPVDGIVWNTNAQNASTASGTQTITNSVTNAANGPVKIVSPLPTTNNGYTQTHILTSLGAPGAIAEHGYASISWEDTVLASVLTNCSTDSIYNIAFSLAAGGVPAPTCFAGTYVCPIEVDCQQKDLTPPRHSTHLTVGNVNSCGNYKEYLDSVYDDSTTDEGLQSISWVVTPNANAVKVDTGTHTSCTNVKVPITVTQIDTIQAPCVYFTFKDCASPPNISYDTICFGRCLPPVPFDTLPPRIRLLNRYNDNFRDTTNFPCEFQCSEWVVTDSVEELLPGLQRDGGLDSIVVISASNMSFNLLHPVTPGMKEDTFTVCVTDSLEDGSIIIRAVDSADNSSMDTMTYCTMADVTPPVLAVDLLQAGQWPVSVSDSQAWDRGLDSVSLTFVKNCWPVPNPSVFTIDSMNDSTCSLHPVSPCTHAFNFTIAIVDTFAIACFTSEVWDCAGNHNPSAPNCSNGKADLFCPTDTVTQISPTEIRVIFSDYHVINGIPINYDVGIDSIWITNVNNMSMLHHGRITSPLTVGTAIHEPDTSQIPTIYPLLDTVFFYVTDTLLHSNIPDSVCWDAADGSSSNPNTAGGQNFLCASTECWDTTLAQDTTSPIVTLTYDPCDSLAVTVTDVRNLDQGIYQVSLDTSAVNILPFSKTESQPGVGSLTFSLPILDRNQSASGHLSALDEYGEQSNDSTDRAIHTTSLGFNIYRQDLAMIASGIVNTTSNTGVTFDVPVYLTSTDTFSLARKNITQFQFQFHIAGSNLLTFVGTKVPPTMPAGWTITPIPGNGPGPGSPFTINGIGPALTATNMTDTLVYLVFSGAKSPDVEEAQIVIDTNDCGDAVSYNGGGDTTITGPTPLLTNYTITLPAPAGRMTGGTVVFMDSCATIVGNNPHPTILSIAPAIPNPFTSSTLVQYTVPNEAEVSLVLYDALGQKIQTLVTEVQKQGTYQTMVSAEELRGGTYFLRLESGGQVCSQAVVIAR